MLAGPPTAAAPIAAASPMPAGVIPPAPGACPTPPHSSAVVATASVVTSANVAGEWRTMATAAPNAMGAKAKLTQANDCRPRRYSRPPPTSAARPKTIATIRFIQSAPPLTELSACRNVRGEPTHVVRHRLSARGDNRCIKVSACVKMTSGTTLHTSRLSENPQGLLGE